MLTVGVVLALLNVAAALALSVGIPFTTSNLTVAGAVGEKERALEVLPGYARGRVASNQDFINHSTTMTIWRAEGVAVVIIGKQAGAPALDFQVALR